MDPPGTSFGPRGVTWFLECPRAVFGPFKRSLRPPWSFLECPGALFQLPKRFRSLSLAQSGLSGSLGNVLLTSWGLLGLLCTYLPPRFYFSFICLLFSCLRHSIVCWSVCCLLVRSNAISNVCERIFKSSMTSGGRQKLE